MPAVTPCAEPSCQAPIFFARTSSGSVMPFDAEPVDDGGWVIIENLALPVGVPSEDRMRYKTHYATCTNPGRFRRRR